jgi:hypothetical protein
MPSDEEPRKPERRKRSTMSHSSPPSPPGGPAPPGGGRGPGSRKEDWIANQLRRVYDEALHEAIPQKMIDLLNALEDRGSDDGEPK